MPAWAEGRELDRGERRRVGAGFARPTGVAGGRRGPPRSARSRPLDVPGPAIDAVRGCVAVERGPLVYCVESTDQPAGTELDSVAAEPTDALTEHVPGGVLGSAVAVEAVGASSAPLTFIPYHAWGNRGLCTMRVWLPEV